VYRKIGFLDHTVRPENAQDLLLSTSSPARSTNRTSIENAFGERVIACPRCVNRASATSSRKSPNAKIARLLFNIASSEI
jgi:hypothetical protein